MRFVLVPDSADILSRRMPLYNGDFSDIKAILNDMFKFMKTARGIGLAAPQVGIEQNFFIMEAEGKRRCVVNPVIIQYSEFKCVFREGCLSFPNLFLEIERAEFITVDYQDENGNFITEDLKGITARCFLHEVDHLNGIVFTKYKG